MNTFINIVLFDYGGVIAEEGFRTGLLAIARNNGLDPDIFYHDICRIIADSGYLTGSGTEAAFWALLRRKYGLVQSDAELRSEILNRFTLRPGMLDSAALLRRGGIRVGMISDQTNWLDELDRRDGFFTNFDTVFNSFHMGASKYRGDLFKAVEAQLQIATGRMLIIDDSAENINKARQRGWASILYQDEQSCFREMQMFFPEIFT